MNLLSVVYMHIRILVWSRILVDVPLGNYSLSGCLFSVHFHVLKMQAVLSCWCWSQVHVKFWFLRSLALCQCHDWLKHITSGRIYIRLLRKNLDVTPIEGKGTICYSFSHENHDITIFSISFLLRSHSKCLWT